MTDDEKAALDCEIAKLAAKYINAAHEATRRISLETMKASMEAFDDLEKKCEARFGRTNHQDS